MDCDIDTDLTEALVTHANAPLTPLGRLRLARCVVDEGWPVRRAAERFQVSVSTVHRWKTRYEAEGEAGMADRSSCPHSSPNRIPTRTERRIIKVRLARRWGPARIAFLLGLNPSTVHRVLVRYRLARLAHLDRATGQPVRRYEHATPGELVHVDIKKLGNIPDGGGHKIHGRAVGNHNKQRTISPVRRNGQPRIGYSYLHNAVDDHSRLAYTEILPDETKETAAAFWHRAHAFFQTNGITIQRVLTDNGSCYRSQLWRDTLTTTGITHKRTRPYRPQTNGKVERFNRTLLDEWAYAHPYRSETERREALPHWLHTYNHHRGHTALNGLPPASRVPNLSDQYTYRAREGLRQAYLQVHLTGTPPDDCRPTFDRLGRWTRGGVSERDAARIREHLESCRRCRGFADELADLNGILRSYLAALVLGTAGAAYLFARDVREPAADGVPAEKPSPSAWQPAAVPVFGT